MNAVRNVPVLATVAAAFCVLAADATIAAAQYPTEPPPPGRMRPLQLPPFEEATLSNGLQVVLVEDRDLPLVSISLTMPAGSAYDPPGQEGLASMVADLLVKGTSRRTADELAAEIEGVGASLNASAGNDFFTLSTTVLREHVDLAFDLMSDVLTNATFPEAEVELTRTRSLSGLQAQEAQPGFLAGKFFSAALYGDHPYGRTATSSTVRSLGRDDVVGFAQTHLRPGGSVLVLAGDIGMADARRLASASFAGWTGEPPSRTDPEIPTTRASEILLVNRPGSAQSNILVGNLTMRPGDPDYYGAVVANKVLGGGVDARLFLILREQNGWTYGAYSNHNRPQGVGRFQANTEVRTEVTDSALAEILHQMRRLRTEPVPDEELQAARGFLVGSFPLSIQTPQSIAGQVRNVRLLGLGDDYLQTYRDRLASINTGGILDVASRVMKPDSAVIVVVGDGQKIYDKLAAIAPVRIINAEGNSLTPADLNPVAAALDLNPDRITARRDSFAIIFQGQTMGSQVSELRIEADSVVFAETLGIAAMGMNQSTTVILARDLGLRSIEQTMQAGPISARTALTFAGGRVVGSAQTPDQTGQIQTTAIDTAMVEGLLETNALQPILPALALREGASFSVMVLNASDGSIRPVTIKVAAIEEVTVPAGTFSAYRVEIQGTETPVHFYMNVGDHRVVKIQPVGQPVSIELAGP